MSSYMDSDIDTVYDFSSHTLEPDDVSDHFPVWAWFYTNMDTE